MSVTFALTAAQAVTRAYRILGNLEPPWVPSDDQMTQGILAANLMQKGWMADGINLWRQEQRSISVPSMARSVVITPYVLGVEQVSWVVTPSPNLYKRPMGMFSYVDYFNLPNPDSNTPSGPSVCMFDKQDTTSTLWLWPKPTNGGTIICSVGRSVNDILTPQDTLDIPSEWTEAFVYNLADRLMDDQGVASADPATAQRISQHAIGLYAKLQNFDRPTSVFMRPWGTAGQSKVWR
jgi:hypothetical protein